MNVKLIEALMTVSNEDLIGAIKDRDVLISQIRSVLAARGLDSDGNYIGYIAASKHHNQQA